MKKLDLIEEKAADLNAELDDLLGLREKTKETKKTKTESSIIHK